MDEPNYVLRANEAVLLPVREPSAVRRTLKIGAGLITGIILAGSFVFQDNLVFALSWPSRILLVLLVAAGFFCTEKMEWTPSLMELRFYDDCLTLCLPERHYGRKKVRREINKMKYAQITKCAYKRQSMRIHFYGAGDSAWYRCGNGLALSEPVKVRHWDRGMLYFSTRLEPDIDFVKEIEDHSPLRVIIEEE